MSQLLQEDQSVQERSNLSGVPFVLGWIVRLDGGRPIVDFPGNAEGPMEALCAAPAPPEFDNLHPGRIPIVLLITGGSSPPVLFGFLRENLVTAQLDVLGVPRRDVSLDGRRMVFTARQEILLSCGKSSIHLTSDGKVIIKGATIVSRASGANKVRGATVRIN